MRSSNKMNSVPNSHFQILSLWAMNGRIRMSLPLLLSSRLGISTLTNEPPPTLAFTSFTSVECWRPTTLDGTDGATIGRWLAGCCHGAAKNRTARKGPSACLIHSSPCVCTSPAIAFLIRHPTRRRRILNPPAASIPRAQQHAKR